MTAQPTPALLRQMIDQNDEKAEEAHARLRKDIRELEDQLARLERSNTELISRWEMMARQPVDGMKINFPLKFVFWIIGSIAVSAFALGGGIWKVTDKVDQMASEQQQYRQTVNEQLQQQRSATDDLRKEFRLLQSNVTDFMIQYGGKRERRQQ